MDQSLEVVSTSRVVMERGSGTISDDTVVTTSMEATASSGSADSSPYASRVIQIHVGPTGELLSIHEAVLRRIPYFEGCLRSRLTEARDRIVKLPEDDSDVISEILKFAYSGTVIKPAAEGETHSPEEVRKLRLLVRTYIVADKFCMPQMQNKLMDSLFNHQKIRMVDPHSIILLSDLPDCPMRKYLIKKYVWNLSILDWTDLCTRTPEFSTFDAGAGSPARDIFEECAHRLRHKGRQDPTKTKKADWHVQV